MTENNSELDERVIAAAALDAAEEQLQSLCASHAGTFVSVERRGQLLEKSLTGLLDSTTKVELQVKIAKQCLDQDEYDDEEKDGEEKEGDDVESKDDDGSGKTTKKEEKSSTNSLAALSERHRVRRRTLLQHSSLQELLELPSLMDACVRSNMYEEALSIAAFSNTLERRHGSGGSGSGSSTENNNNNNNIVVSKVIDQVRSRQHDLRRHLLHRLKNYVTMPQCLEVVTALRRLNSIDLERHQNQKNSSSSNQSGGGGAEIERIHSAMELKLEVDFLESRDAWLDSTSSSATGGVGSGSGSAVVGSTALKNAIPVRSSEQLLDTIERYRTRVFEIATQYNAIFRADNNNTATNNSNNSNNNNNNMVSLLSMWVSRRVHSFLTMLTIQLNRMDDTASIRDALEECVFFSTSLGRLGADFTAQLPPLFERRVHVLILNIWNDSEQQLSEILKICRNVGVASPLVSSSSSSTTTNNKAESGGGDLEQPQGGESSSNNNDDINTLLSPPRLLMTLPALGNFVNTILIGLNDLRRCLLPGIFIQLRQSLNEILKSTKSILSMNHRAVNAPGFRGETIELRNVASQMITIFDDIVQPYLLGALEYALGNDNKATEYHQQVQFKLNPPKPPEPEPEPEPELKEEDEEQEKEEKEKQEGEEGSDDTKENNNEEGEVDGKNEDAAAADAAAADADADADNKVANDDSAADTSKEAEGEQQDQGDDDNAESKPAEGGEEEAATTTTATPP